MRCPVDLVVCDVVAVWVVQPSIVARIGVMLVMGSSWVGL